MKKSCFLFLVFALAAAPAIKAQHISEPDTLHDAFLVRPLSIIKEEPRWNLASTDLYTAWLGNGFYGLYGPQPQIMLNGIPINANFFGWQNLNMLPVFSNHINNASSRFAPGVYEHSVADAGLINFVTESLKNGITVKAFYYTGNETKDPGPWAYDSLKMSPNIDRWGPDKGILLAYKGNNWHMKGLYLKRFHKPRGLEQNLRLHITNSLLGSNSSYVNYPLFIDSKSALFKAGYHSTHWQLSTRFILARNDDYLFLQPFGREVPVQVKYNQLAIQSNYHKGPWGFFIRYLLDDKALGKREERHIYIFDWQQMNHTITFSAGYKNELFHLNPGITFKQLNTDAPGLDTINDKILTLFFKGSITQDSYKLYLNNYLDYNLRNSTKSISIKIGAALRLSDSYTANPEIVYAESNPIRQHSFAYWVNRGYTFNERLQITFDKPAYVTENEALSLKLANRFSIGEGIKVQVVPQLIKNDRLNIPWQIVEWYRPTNTRPGSFTVTQHSGTRFKLLISGEHAASSVFRQSLALYLQKTISGSTRYRNYFKMIPDTKIKYEIDIHPVDGLRLSLNAVYRSPVTWKEYAAVEGKEYSLPAGIPIGEFRRTFHTTVPAFINLGASIQKWFFDNHLSTQFGVQNILDQEVRYHAIGASLYPKINFKISLHY